MSNLLIQVTLDRANKYWVDVEGYNGKYKISNDGLVKGNRTLKPYLTGKKGNQYLCVKLHGDKPLNIKVHRLVGLHFIPNPNNKKCINHKDGNKLNNCVTNLEWVTHSENTQHSFDNKLQIPLKGKDVYNSIPVIDTKTNKVYSTITEASRELNIPRQTLTKWLNGIHANKSNLKYYE